VDLDEPVPEPFLEEPNLLPLPTITIPFATKQIDSIKDNRNIFTRDDSCRRYLVRWKDCPECDDTWIT